MTPPFIPKLDSIEDTKYFLHNKNSGIYSNNINKRITNRIKRTNLFFNRNDSGESINRISFPKFCFQFNRYIKDIESNLYNELMEFTKNVVEEKIKNNTLENDSNDEKSFTESLVNISSNRLSARTYSRDKILNNNIFSPNSSSKLSYKTVLSDTKKTLNILPVRNLMNLKKNQIMKNENKNKDNNIKKEDKKARTSNNQDDI